MKMTLSAFCLLFAGLGLDATAQAGTHQLDLMIAEQERHCIIHVPARCSAEKNHPLVLFFHGGGGTAQSAIDETGWIEKADREGFIVAFPEGTPRHQGRPSRFVGNPQTWNDGSERTGLGAVAQGVDDVAFVSALLDALAARYPVDPQRIYTTGFSNGASLSFRLARELSTRFAAAAPVAGVDWLSGPVPDRPVPVLYIVGTADPKSPYFGGEIRIGDKFYGIKPPTQQMMETWAHFFTPAPSATTSVSPSGTIRTAYAAPDGRESVICLAIPGHGHHWPGGNSKLPEWFAGKNSSTLNATDIIWEFFRQQSCRE